MILAPSRIGPILTTPEIAALIPEERVDTSIWAAPGTISVPATGRMSAHSTAGI